MSTALVFTVESLGKGSANRVYHFANAPAPSWDSDGVWFDCWTMRTPSSTGTEVDIRSGSSTVAECSFEIYRTDGLAFLFYQARTELDQLQAALPGNPVDAAYNTIELSGTTHQGKTIITGKREAVYLSNHVGAGVYDCARARLGTVAEDHTVNDGDFVSVFDASWGPILKHRRVTLYRVNLATATSYSDLETLETYVVSEISLPTPDRIRIECDSLWSVVEQMSFYRSPWRTRLEVSRAQPVNNLGQPTGPERVRYTARSQRQTPLSSSTALLCIDGECVVEADLITLGTGETLAQFTPSDIYRISAPTIPDDPKEAWEVLHCTNGATTDPDALPLSGNLLTLLLQIMLTTDRGYNGPYDLGIKDFGLGIPQGYVDVAGIEQLRSQLGSLLDQSNLFVGISGEPEKFMDFFQGKLLAYGMTLTGIGDQIGIVFIDGNAALITTTLEEGTDIVGPVMGNDAPVQTRRMDWPFDRIKAQWNGVPGLEPITDTFDDGVARLINIYGGNQSIEVDLTGVGSERDEGREKVRRLCADLIRRFHYEIPEVSFQALRTRTDVQVGDLVLVTHSKVMKYTGGTLGVTDAPMLVIERPLNLESNLLDFRCIYLGALYARVGAIAPACVVASYTSGATVTVSENALQSGNHPDYPKDTSAFEVGDYVDHCDSTLTIREAALKIDAKTDTTLTFSDTPSNTPVAGDIFVTSSYDNCTAAQRLKWAFIADDSNNKIPSSAADPYQWT